MQSEQSNETINESSQKPMITGMEVYKLGQIQFKVSHCDADFIGKLHQILPQVPTHEQVPDSVLDVRMGCTGDVRQLANHILKRHHHCLWMDAACLVSPSGKKVLVIGKSHSGKSTLAMALSLAYGWKLLAEDIALIDPENGQIVAFASPFSLKQGTSELLKETVGKAPENIVLDEWSLITPYVELVDQFVPFDVVINLELKIERKLVGEPLETHALTTPEFIRCLLPLSNVLRKQASEKFATYIQNAQRLHVGGGTLLERLELLHQLCGEKWSSPQLNSNDATDGENAIRFLTGEHILTRISSVKTEVQEDGYCVLSDVASNKFAFTLAPLGSLVWELSDGTLNVDQIIRDIAKILSASEGDLRDAIFALSEELVSAELLVAHLPT